MLPGDQIQSEPMMNWLSVGATTGERSFLGTSSSILLFVVSMIVLLIRILSEIPFCTTFTFPVMDVVLVPAEEVLVGVFEPVSGFLVGDDVKVFVVEVRFTVLLVVFDVEETEVRVVFVAVDPPVRAREICLFAVSLICLSIIGDLAAPVVRGLAVLLETGAVLGLAAAVLAVVALLLDFTAGLLAVDVDVAVAEVDLGLDAAAPVDVRVLVADLTSEVLVAPAVVAGLLVVLAADGLLRDFTSPFAVGFFSVAARFVFTAAATAVVDDFGFVAVTLVLEVVFGAAVVFEAAAVVAGFAAAVLAAVLETPDDFFAVSSSLGREVVLVAGFFVAKDGFVAAPPAFEGEVGVDFGVDFVAAGFGGFAADLMEAFGLVCEPALAAAAAAAVADAVAVTATAAAATAPIPVDFSFFFSGDAAEASTAGSTGASIGASTGAAVGISTRGSTGAGTGASTGVSANTSTACSISGSFVSVRTSATGSSLISALISSANSCIFSVS